MIQAGNTQQKAAMARANANKSSGNQKRRALGGLQEWSTRLSKSGCSCSPMFPCSSVYSGLLGTTLCFEGWVWVMSSTYAPWHVSGTNSPLSKHQNDVFPLFYCTWPVLMEEGGLLIFTKCIDCVPISRQS